MEEKNEVKEEMKKNKKTTAEKVKIDNASKDNKKAKKETKKVTKKEKVEDKNKTIENKKEKKEKINKEAIKKAKKNNKNKTNSKEVKLNNESNEEIKKEDDLTFRRVEIKQEKKNHRFLKFILTLVIILIAAYCIFFSRNFIILNNIYNQMCEIGSSKNYSYEMVRKEEGKEVTKITYYKKDNVERVDLEDQNQKVNTITDLESNQITTWYPEEKTATIYNTEVTTKVRLPLEESINYQESRAFMGLTSIIYSEEYNSKDCYVIMQICRPSMMDCSEKTWIDKETGLVVKREYLNYTVEYNNIELNNVRNIDAPDLRTYKVEKED